VERKNKIYGIVGFISVIFGFIAKTFYRPYALINDLNDFEIADCLPSLFSLIGGLVSIFI